ncbi:MAG TPA: DUF1622 domain-containing protein [Candidatus Magasanikbacteria bacterium]|jgi:uncharacterized membrane protein|nr:DUF1622 domain-containing protein [Candidatus Magasanikbacteria bacterium]HQL52686.1 DUF1622 domain-containing protein [Candidatus Magasanikbacteria bacterium]
MLFFWEIITKIIETIGYIIEYIGLGIIIISISTTLYKLSFKKQTLNNIHNELTKKIIFGLEFIIAADILLITIANNFTEIIQLGSVVIIRILLGYDLRKEIVKQK